MSGSIESTQDLVLKQMLFSTRGRIPRVDAVFAALCVLIILAIAGALWFSFALTYFRQIPYAMLLPWVWGPLIAPGIALLWTWICIFAKRCHDRNRSAWFLLLSLIPVVGLWVFIELVFFRGSPDLNRFGPPPAGMISQWQAANSDM